MRSKNLSSDRSVLFISLLPVLAFAFIVLGQRWLPRHDTMQNLEWAHYLFSNLAQGEFPAWAPYMNWGKNTNLGFLAFLHPSFIFLSPLLALPVNWNVASLFYLSLALNELVLIVGIFLLSRRLFEKKATIVFVSFCTIGGIHWVSQVNFNFLYYYAIPLILYFILTGAEEGKPTKIIGAAVLLAVTGTVGNGLYLVIFQGVVFLVFLATSLWVYKTSVSSLLRKRTTSDLLLLLTFFVVVALSAQFLMHSGMPSCTSPNRSETGKISYGTFLSYEADPGINNFSGFLFGLENPLDVTSFAGVFIGLFCILGLIFAPRAKQLPVLATLVFCFLFYLGASSFVAPLAYYFPLVSMYRHIGSVVPIIKTLLVLLAGFGFDRFVERAEGKAYEGDRYFLPVLFSLIMAGGAILIGTYFIHEPQGFTLGGRRLLVTLIGIAALILAALTYSKDKAVRAAVVPLFLAVVAVDVFSYRSLLLHRGLMPATDTIWKLFEVRAFSGRPERLLSQFDDPAFTRLSTMQYPAAFADHPQTRAQISEKLMTCEKEKKGCYSFDLNRLNVIYDINEQFVNTDSCFHLGLSHHTLPHVFDFYNYYDLISPVASRIQHPAYKFPSPRLMAAARCGSKKVERLGKLTVLDQDRDVAKYLVSEGEAAPELITSKAALEDYLSEPGSPAREQILSTPLRAITSSDDEIKFEKYTPTYVAMSTSGKPSWLYFADSWHENWKATINGAAVPILRANHAFKAVFLPEGRSFVQFQYDTREDWSLAILIWLESTIFIAGVFWLGIKQADLKFFHRSR